MKTTSKGKSQPRIPEILKELCLLLIELHDPPTGTRSSYKFDRHTTTKTHRLQLTLSLTAEPNSTPSEPE